MIRPLVVRVGALDRGYQTQNGEGTYRVKVLKAGWKTRATRDEEVIGRIAVIGEGLATLTEKVNRHYVELTRRIDAARAEMHTMFASRGGELQTKFDRIMVRLDALAATPHRARRRKQR